MSGASRKHDDIATQLHLLFGEHLRGKDCRWHTSDMRVQITLKSYTYPDLTVVCGRRQFADSQLDTLVNPTLIVEILSPTTENYDRGRKVKMYREIDSLQELLLISQDAYEVELSRRQAEGSWSLREVKGLEGAVEPASIGYTLRLGELYEKVIGESE